VQVGDQTRLDASSSFVTPDEGEITLIEIKPEASADFFDVTGTKYLDWAYSTAETKTVSVRITTDGSPTTATFTLSAITSATDNLWSSDADLKLYESAINSFLPPGRSTFKNIHRVAKRRIIDWLDQNGYFSENNPYEKLADENFTAPEDMREWATHVALSIIFANASTKPDDNAAAQAERYGEMANAASRRVILRLDLNEDGETDDGEGKETGNSMIVVRR
jgi:hypothetical protein